MINEIFKEKIEVNDNFIYLKNVSVDLNQQQTNDAFSEKWTAYEKTEEKDKLYDMQKEWYLTLYGFENEEALAEFLRTKKYIFDAGCGLGYKAKWFADLSPNSIVIGMDFSDASFIAANNYKETKNLFFIKGDIALTPFKDDVIDYVSCDQVIMHTEIPEKTFAELTRVTKQEFSCYVYAKKALPRELLDEHFRSYCKDLSNEELWEMSNKLTDLGKTLSELDIKIDVPDIPQMNIKGGEYDLQRFIYWNFLKCFWNEELGRDTSVATNFDWYSPSNAKRYSEEEYKKIISDSELSINYFHSEEACYSGRFSK
ncbi:MAG: SAM-dependent methyltransferase [uncultured Sulfurovum sp.]|uniref:SAM-dependent methyltransferase n=1 Tax=uncultured Sulfurovum sp. TaxID=269237 RepID=A0A6S6SPB0_9BACT|nr:MAG: SAM-dependent methyltransferase [uncultured Sulfurovum sp.]